MGSGPLKTAYDIVENGSFLHQYILVIEPPPVISELIAEQQQHIMAISGLPQDDILKPFIAIAYFSAREEMEETLIRWISKICNRFTSFGVVFNNFSGFPPHNIYVRIQDPFSFRQVYKSLQAIGDFISVSPVRYGWPHCKISGNLPEKIFEKVLFDYSKKTFHESFTASELILKKKSTEKDKTKTINIFHLMPVACEHQAGMA